MTSQVRVKKAPMWSEFLELCKPRVVMMMILTSVVGMCLASPYWVPWSILWWGNLGIALCASSAAAINHLADYRIDRLMQRTQHRPIAQGRISVKATIVFASILCLLGIFILVYFINSLTAVLTFLSLVAYAGVYTFYLKHATAQNIVIGGIAGAAPPLLGWVAVTGHIGLQGVFLLLIIFVWTPPHFWALAIDRIEDYAKASVPMLPNTRGIHYTKQCMVWYTIILSGATLLPFLLGNSGWLYFLGVIVLDCWFLYSVVSFYRDSEHKNGMRVFYRSIYYLMLLFVLLLVDHYVHLW